MKDTLGAVELGMVGLIGRSNAPDVSRALLDGLKSNAGTVIRMPNWTFGYVGREPRGGVLDFAGEVWENNDSVQETVELLHEESDRGMLFLSTQNKSFVARNKQAVYVIDFRKTLGQVLVMSSLIPMGEITKKCPAVENYCNSQELVMEIPEGQVWSFEEDAKAEYGMKVRKFRTALIYDDITVEPA